MLSKILKKKAPKEENQSNPELVQKIAKMNLTEMRSYINNNIKDFEVSEEGLYEVMKKLTTPDPKTQKYYISIDDMDSKKKKAFDLVLAIAKSKKITLKTLELIQIFQETHKELIEQYDYENKQIYYAKFTDIIKVAIANLKQMSELKKKMTLLGQD